MNTENNTAAPNGGGNVNTENVVDEFDIENRHYVVSSVVEDDVIQTDGQYIYQCHLKGGDFTVEPILDPKEFEHVTRAYMEM